MDFELRKAKEKLEKEQRERKERARIKMEKERKAKNEAARQREAIEADRRERRLEAARAQEIANQQMEENILAGDGVSFFRILEAVPYQGHGDKIKLPSSCFTELSDQGALDKGPMFFKLTRVGQNDSGSSVPPENQTSTRHQNGASTHSGVLEFTAPDGQVELPPHTWANLFPAAVDMIPLIEVQYVRLPKGTYAKLQPDTSRFLDLPNHRAVLETALRQHATLSEGDILTLNLGGLSYKLAVLELKPSSSVSVLETDIEVDIVGPESASEMRNDRVLNPLILGKVESGDVEEEKYRYYKFIIDDKIMENVSSGEMVVEVKLELEANGGDTDLYMSRHPILYPTKHHHQWSSHDVGSKVLILGDEAGFASGTYSIAVFGYKGANRYRISVALRESSGNKHGERATSSAAPSESDSVKCSNCGHFILSRSIALHEAYCSRNNVVCQYGGCGLVLRKDEAANHVHCLKCDRALHKGELEKHLKVFHEPLTCACGVSLEKEAMVVHQSSDCPLRLITCRFCGDMVPAGSSPADVRDRMRGLSEHESACGSRTAPCDSCGRSVMLKEMDIHQIAVHSKS